MRRCAPLPLLALACPLFALLACERPAAHAPEPYSVRDSAGIRIVHNDVSDDDLARLILRGPPLLRLGSEDEGAELFGHVEGAHLGPHDDLWVVDGMAAEARVFSLPDGAHRFTAGRRGEGPGELAAPSLIGFGPDGEALIWDRSLARLTTFSPEGALLGAQGIMGEGELPPVVRGRMEDGRLVAQRPQVYRGTVRDGMIIQDTMRLWALEPDGADPVLLATRRGGTWLFAGRQSVPVPFTGAASFAVRGDHIVLSDDDGGPTLDLLERGRLVRRIHVRRERPRVTGDLLDAELESPRYGDVQRALLRPRLGDVGVPDVVPTWAWLRLGRDGRVFALRHGTLFAGETWDVFDPDGRLVALLELEDGSHLMDADAHHIAVLEMPEDAGQRVAVHRWPDGGAAGRDRARAMP